MRYSLPNIFLVRTNDSRIVGVAPETLQNSVQTSRILLFLVARKACGFVRGGCIICYIESRTREKIVDVAQSPKVA